MMSPLEAVRISRGLTQNSLASATGVSQTTISLFESGRSEPSEATVNALATELDVPAALLQLSASPVQLLHTMKDSVAAKAVKRVMAEFTLAFHRTALLAPMTRHTIRALGDADESASARAERLRLQWGTAPGRVLDIVAALESHAVICLRRDLSGTRVNALAARSEGGRALMFIDPSADVEDASWAVAHELGHLALHDTADAGQEEPAEEFAGEYLAPRSELRALLDAGADCDDLPEVFAVPPSRFATHARRGRLITASDYRRLRTQSIPPFRRDPLPHSTHFTDVVHARVDAGESIADIAASAFLTEDELRLNYL